MAGRRGRAGGVEEERHRNGVQGVRKEGMTMRLAIGVRDGKEKQAERRRGKGGGRGKGKGTATSWRKDPATANGKMERRGNPERKGREGVSTEGDRNGTGMGRKGKEKEAAGEEGRGGGGSTWEAGGKGTWECSGNMERE